MVSKGILTLQDIEDAKSNKDSGIVSIGLPAYCLLQYLLRSAKANAAGLLCSKCKCFSFRLACTAASKNLFIDNVFCGCS